MWGDIKERIRQLGFNIDLMYQIFERKIAVITQRISNETPEHLEQELRVQSTKVSELERSL